MTTEYYELRGLDPQSKMPSGMFRIIETNTKLWYERITLDGRWVMDNTLVRYIAGYTNEAEKISKAKADKFEAYLKSGQGIIDKENNTWG